MSRERFRPLDAARGASTTRRCAVFTVALLALVACAPAARRPGGGGGLDGSAPDFGADVDAGPDVDLGATVDAGQGADGGGVDLGRVVDSGPPADAGLDAGAAPIPACNRTCTLAAECAGGTLTTDTNNYACTRGLCEYLGCVNDEECFATFAPTGGDWRCVTPTGGGIPTCSEVCGSAADCASPSPAVDADNYACERGTCRYLGCRNDDECTATFGAAGGAWRCSVLFAGGLPTCTEVCRTAADCASAAPSVDADNYVCESGTCRYLGCLNDAECRDTFGASTGNWVCR
jgi:hypothetical protein